ncbi:MAG: hypothetical protein RJB62_1708 [Pseudomonadota bacterium]|jgi:gamma-glutamyl:cysteine ligase YbdK (ATP-grasp superfamily)
MGEEIAKTSFTPEDHAEFERRLAHETKLLGESLKAGRFSNEGFSLGFEVETWILDHNYFPLPVNAELLKAFDNEDAIPELSKFNVELTCPPRVLEGTVFSDARAAFETLLGDANEVARGLGGQLVMIGTLPTIREGDLTLDNLTPSKRFYALNTEVLRQRGGRPLRIDIEGEERLVSEHYDVMMEAGTTSFQVHLKTPVSVAHRYFNASVMASAPVLAAAVNAPFLLGKSLWDETRIPLFEQSVDLHGRPSEKGAPGSPRVTFGSGYAKESLFELLAENSDSYPGLLPILFDDPPDHYRHISLQNGTLWRWNRPLVGADDTGRPHLRHETRGIPAGPSFLDSLANAAFHIGLVFHLVAEDWDKEPKIPFADAKANFYAAARHGLNARFTWPGSDGRSRAGIAVPELILEELLPAAREGLRLAGVAPSEATFFLSIIESRVRTGQTGASWQRAFVARHGKDFLRLMSAYCENQRARLPVHAWAI